MTKPNILLGLTGSVASILVDQLLNSLREIGQIQTIATDCAQHFLKTVAASQDTVDARNIKRDEDEWKWYHKGDPVLHIELRRWADVFVIAPMSANTLAKVANGLADNLLTNVARCWDYKKPLVFAPAMNTFMWDHPVTKKQTDTLLTYGAKLVYPQKKMLACGDEGAGGMADISQICDKVKRCL